MWEASFSGPQGPGHQQEEWSTAWSGQCVAIDREPHQPRSMMGQAGTWPSHSGTWGQAVLGQLGLLASSQICFLLRLTLLGDSREPGSFLPADPVPGPVWLAQLSWMERSWGALVSSLSSSVPDTGGHGPLGTPAPHFCNRMLALGWLGFLPGFDENMERVVVVITGIKRAVS